MRVKALPTRITITVMESILCRTGLELRLERLEQTHVALPLTTELITYYQTIRALYQKLGEKIGAPDPWPDRIGAAKPTTIEEQYQRHLAAEMPSGHPDGCFWCGSHEHASTDCQNRE